MCCFYFRNIVSACSSQLRNNYVSMLLASGKLFYECAVSILELLCRHALCDCETIMSACCLQLVTRLCMCCVYRGNIVCACSLQFHNNYVSIVFASVKLFYECAVSILEISCAHALCNCGTIMSACCLQVGNSSMDVLFLFWKDCVDMLFAIAKQLCQHAVCSWKALL